LSNANEVRINENTITSAFWLVFEVLRDKTLQNRVYSEIAESFTCSQLSGRRVINIDALLQKPLLQSCYAETLRLHVSSAALRTNRFEDYQLGNFVIKKNQCVLLPTRPSALNQKAWGERCSGLKKSLQEFDADRFLTEVGSKGGNCRGENETKPEPTFSMDGLAGLWIPFGGGHHICPGRHFAKMEMMVTLAVLLDSYDVELEMSKHSKVQEDLWYYPNGALPPRTAVAFRIKNKKK
jgi:cytochrome P450